MTERKVEVTADASGAAAAARKGRVVVIVDVIDFSTTMEAALAAGALQVWGASPGDSRAPVALAPWQAGWLAGCQARQLGVEVIVVAEPRVGREAERQKNALQAICGVERSGAEIKALVPNLGAETVKILDFENSVVLGVSASGGTAFDAALTAGGRVCTATIARIRGISGFATACRGIERAKSLAAEKKTGITIVAASGNCLEDLLGANYLAGLLTKRHKLVPIPHMI